MCLALSPQITQTIKAGETSLEVKDEFLLAYSFEQEWDNDDARDLIKKLIIWKFQ